MNCNVTKEYQQALAAGKSYFSTCEEIVCGDVLALYTAAETAKGARYFWRNPDQTMTIAAFHWLVDYQKPRLSTFDSLQKDLKDRHYQPRTDACQALLLGGFAFDETHTAQAEWGQLGSGLFVLPEIMIKQEGDQTWVVYTVKATNEEQWLAKVAALRMQVMQWVADSQHCAATAAFSVVTGQVEVAVPEWLQAVEDTVQAIKEPTTDLTKVVLARQMRLTTTETIRSEAVLAHLSQQQPNTYVFAMEHGETFFIGATPERLLKATVDYFETVSIAGSAPRGQTEAEDQLLAAALLQDPKNTHEHQVVVDRLTHALSSLIEGGFHSETRAVIKNRDIQHLFLPLKGKRQTAVSFLTAVQKLHPTPALGGEPKTAAVLWIKAHEPNSRGMYGGPFGWLGIQEDIGEFAVAIRSGVVTQNRATLYAGCGIVADSQAVDEQQETRLKFQPMRRGIIGDV